MKKYFIFQEQQIEINEEIKNILNIFNQNFNY